MSVYLYCITQSDGFPGVVNSLGTGPVYAVHHEGLACVVSDWHGKEIAALTKEQLVHHLLDQQRVVEQVMARCTVLPVKFGTFLPSLNEVSDFLAQAGQQLWVWLKDLRGKVELEVAATWDVDRALKEAARDENIVQAVQSLKCSGQPALQDRIGIGQLVKACLDRRRRGYRDATMARLAPLALDTSSHSLISDSMVMNAAFLMDKTRQVEFDATINELDKSFGNEINFRIVGPLPPYSFSTLEIASVTAQEIERAKSVLGLGDDITEGEIKKVYRREMAKLYPALQTNNNEASQEKLGDIRQAYTMLLGWRRITPHLVALPGNSEKPVFMVTTKKHNEEDVEPARFGGRAPILQVGA